MKGLARICKDGIDSISGGIRELEAHGYLIRARVRGANGRSRLYRIHHSGTA